MPAGKGAGLQRDMQALRAAASDAAASFMVPPAVKAALPALVRVIEAQAHELQELRELYRRPCEGCGGGCGGGAMVPRDEAGMAMLAVSAGMHG